VIAAETVEETEGVPERVWLSDSVCVILPDCVELRVPVEVIETVLLPEIVGFAVTVSELEGVGSLEPEGDPVELLEDVEDRVTVRVIVRVPVWVLVACAEPDTLEVPVRAGV